MKSFGFPAGDWEGNWERSCSWKYRIVLREEYLVGELARVMVGVVVNGD